MTLMTTDISKEEFEEQLPVATEPTGRVFASCRAALEETGGQLSAIFGQSLMERLSAPQHPVRPLLVRTLCLRAFASALPQLDLTMTPDGFAVASTNKIAPASKERVQRLADSLDILWREALDSLAGYIYADTSLIALWTSGGAPSRLIRHIFWRRTDLCAVLGIDSRSLHDPFDAFSRLYALDPQISFYISDTYLRELMQKTGDGALSPADLRLIPLLRRAYAAAVRGVPVVDAVRPLLIEMKRNIADYPAYASSPEYEIANFDRYENKKDDPTFFFGL